MGRYSLFLGLAIVMISLASQLFSGLSDDKQFSVIYYGAKGDGLTDATGAFLRTWKASCQYPTAATMLIPSGDYVLSPLKLTGSCQCPQLTVKIDGVLLSPENKLVISNAKTWIKFDHVKNVIIQGGTLEGRGGYFEKCKGAGAGSGVHDSKCPYRGRMMTIFKSSNVWIKNVAVRHSQGFHISVEESDNVNIMGATIDTPSLTSNTDGLHIEKSTRVTVTGSSFGTGDDCISIGPGSKNIWIQDVRCGPGHGISIGSMAGKSGEGDVKNITVKGVQFTDTENGFRIKAWARANPVSVSDVLFMDATMAGVRNPICIDEFYCPGGGCRSQPSLAQISSIEFKKITGTSKTVDAITFNCSSRAPCTGLKLAAINLVFIHDHSPPLPAQSRCVNAPGLQIIKPVVPDVSKC